MHCKGHVGETLVETSFCGWSRGLTTYGRMIHDEMEG